MLPYEKVEIYKPFLSITTNDSDLVNIISPKSSCLEITSPKSSCLEITSPKSSCLEITSPKSSCLEITSPKSLCEVDGCYHTAIDKLCKEHQMYTSMEYLIAHKPIQSPVAHSKYNFEQRGLACIQLQPDE